MASPLEGERIKQGLFPMLQTVLQTRLQNWMDILATQRAGLCLYQWLWLILCVVGGLVVVAPRVLTQPVVYQTSTTVHFDADLYRGLYSEDQPSADFNVALQDALYALQQRSLAERDVRFGSPSYRVDYIPQEQGLVTVKSIAPTATEAQTLATNGADELVRQIRAAGGREVLRNLLGWELVAAMRNNHTPSSFEHHLRTIIERDAFPMSRPIEPVSARISVENLSPEEQQDLTRALEARYDLWTFEINTRNATLDALCGTAQTTTTAAREAALQACATVPVNIPQEQREALQNRAARVMAEMHIRDRAIARRQAIEGALRYMLQNHNVAFAPQTHGTVSHEHVPIPSAPVPRHIAPLLTLTVLMSAAFGATGVAIDRSAGLMLKLRELWDYRELIRNLVIRDLRVRYKGSVLGYVWTQLAPLLMMLVFLFVFTFMMPSNISMYAVFLLVGLLPWNYCSEAVAAGTRSILDNAHLINKIFFPREILPLVSIFSSLLNYILSLPMMFLIMAIAQLLALGTLNFSPTIAYLPIIIVIQTLFLIGVTLFLSALAVFFRDIVHLVGILLLFWFFLTPVFYSLNAVSLAPLARLIRWGNPMASIIEFYREILYGSAVPIGQIPTPALPAPDSMLRVLATTFLSLAIGYWFFQRQSEQFGEEL